jgi:hypothetical protein
VPTAQSSKEKYWHINLFVELIALTENLTALKLEQKTAKLFINKQLIANSLSPIPIMNILSFHAFSNSLISPIFNIKLSISCSQATRCYTSSLVTKFYNPRKSRQKSKIGKQVLSLGPRSERINQAH